jgi:hypothetical protein
VHPYLEHEDTSVSAGEIQVLVIAASSLRRGIAVCGSARTAVRYKGNPIRAGERDAFVSLSASCAGDASAIFAADRAANSQLTSEVGELGVSSARLVREAVADAVDSLQGRLRQVEFAHR